jgi:hypothetical protein
MAGSVAGRRATRGTNPIMPNTARAASSGLAAWPNVVTHVSKFRGRRAFALGRKSSPADRPRRSFQAVRSTLPVSIGLRAALIGGGISGGAACRTAMREVG